MISGCEADSIHLALPSEVDPKRPFESFPHLGVPVGCLSSLIDYPALPKCWPTMEASVVMKMNTIALTKLFSSLLLLQSMQALAEDDIKLAARLQADKVEFCRGESISFRADIENQSRSPIIMYGDLGWGLLGGFALRIEDEAARVVQPRLLDDYMIIPSTLKDERHYVTLFEGHFIGTARTDQAFDLFPSSGKYKVWVVYRSPVPHKLSLFEESFLSRERGNVTSSALTLTVLDSASCPDDSLERAAD